MTNAVGMSGTGFDSMQPNQNNSIGMASSQPLNGALSLLRTSYQPPSGWNPQSTPNYQNPSLETPQQWQQSNSNPSQMTGGAMGAYGSGAVIPQSYGEFVNPVTFQPTNYDPTSAQYPYDPAHPFAASISDQGNTGNGVSGTMGMNIPQGGNNQFFHPPTATPWAGNNPTNSNQLTSNAGVGGLTQTMTK